MQKSNQKLLNFTRVKSRLNVRSKAIANFTTTSNSKFYNTTTNGNDNNVNSNSNSNSKSNNNNNSQRYVVAIRREDNSIWERRAPLAPVHVEKLTKAGVRILIQPSNRRAYPLQSYIRAGAEAKEDISEAPVVLGVKQVPANLLLPSKTYCFFSHTIKAQEANMPLLDAVLEKNIRLIDYERLVDKNDKRVVAFGQYAGVAGMINILHGLGLRLLALGHHTPFMHVGPAHNYRNTGCARQAIRDAGYEIALGKMPRSIGPLTFVFTGSGNVSQGAQQVFNELPVEYVDPSDLREAAERGSTSKIYGTVVKRGDHLIRKQNLVNNNNNQFNNNNAINIVGNGKQPTIVDLDEYNTHPERYESTFSSKIAPFASVIINGVYWPPNAPRLLRIPDAKLLQQTISGGSATTKLNILPSTYAMQQQHSQQSIGSPALPHRLVAICDISADPGGSIEFMQQCTTIDNPFILYDAETNSSSEQSFAGKGFLVCSIDNMPTQLPLESTDMFGNLLFPYIMDIVKSDASRALEEEQFSSVVSSAIIASNGKLQPSYEYIAELRAKQSRNARLSVDKQMHASCSSTLNGEGNAAPNCSSTGNATADAANRKQVLVLGAGHVSKPLVEFLCRSLDIQVTIVSQFDKEIKNYETNVEHNENLNAFKLNVVEQQDKLIELIQNSDLVISLLPYSMHTMIGKLCIEHRVNMLTASYLTDEMKSQLNNAAQMAGITIVNEVGLDPGIDHLLAKQVIDDVRINGGKVTSLLSYCCGLPMPEFANNPLGYKFGWNPTGAFNITLNGACWLNDGFEFEAKPGELMSFANPLPATFLRGFSLEAFPNRNSLEYKSLYQLNDVKTLIRGTMRYTGFSETIEALKLLGLMDTTQHSYLDSANGSSITWKQLISELVGHSDELTMSHLKSLVLERVGRSESKLNSIVELGLLESTQVVKCGSLFNTIRHKLTTQYLFEEGEKDLVMMKLEFNIEWPDKINEKRALSLIVYGDQQQHLQQLDKHQQQQHNSQQLLAKIRSNNFSAMAKTVGYPAAIAAEMILRGEIQDKGTIIPLAPEIYNPMLRRLSDEGIFARETRQML